MKPKCKHFLLFLAIGELVTVNPLYNEFDVRVDQAFIIKKFVNAITNYSLYISNNSL